MNFSFTLCPESIARLPAKGRSAFVRAAIIKFGSPASTSKGLPAAAPPVAVPPVAPVAVEQVAVPPAPVVVEPVAWKRSWSKPPREFPDGFDYTSLVWDKARKIFLNPPPWPAVPSLDMEQARSWSEYAAKWSFPDPFPGPLEWYSMGEPSEPLPEHSRFQEPSEESPLPVVESAPSQECPLPVAELPVVELPVVELPVAELPVEPLPVEPVVAESPLPVVGVSSSNILEEV